MTELVRKSQDIVEGISLKGTKQTKLTDYLKSRNCIFVVMHYHENSMYMYIVVYIFLALYLAYLLWETTSFKRPLFVGF